MEWLLENRPKPAAPSSTSAENASGADRPRRSWPSGAARTDVLSVAGEIAGAWANIVALGAGHVASSRSQPTIAQRRTTPAHNDLVQVSVGSCDGQIASLSASHPEC